ncbi:sigma-70 family RNA polymerase sigma factor [Paenibacillus humicola]|uniref:sigma-70 family RNA polymerase sigma factor n=1 Tax=Paenibacillus humicola TaxID=3110540 RepID=UPI00237BF019|nr:sigma-70 family RNA polymerase sigma factor [Paenibacillus humicola]
MDLEPYVKIAQKGDREAFFYLIKHIEKNLYGVARSIVKRDEDCADAIQETILKSYRSLHTLREPGFFKSWILRILINECNQIIRKQKRTVLAEAKDFYVFSDCEAERIDLRDAVDRLEESLRIVITLYYFEDMPLKQIADVLETSEGTIKSRLHRARLNLAKWLRIPEERNIRS